MDFVALMKYGGPGKRLDAALGVLEAGSPPELRRVRALMECLDYAVGQRENPTWQTAVLLLPGRPKLPSTEPFLQTPEDFYLRFGADTIRVYHRLRWSLFLTDLKLRPVMLDAVAALGRLFAATDCVLTSDYSAADGAFRKGASFEEALRRDEEVPDLDDLYLTGPDVWDSEGYWRYHWPGILGPARPWPPRPARACATAVPAVQAASPADPDVLERHLHDLRFEVRRKKEKAAEALGALGPAALPAVPDLLVALARPHPGVRARAAAALGRISDSTEVAEALGRLIADDPDESVQRASRAALVGVGAPAVAVLAAVLPRADDQHRRVAVDALTALGPRARPALPALLDALGEGQIETRRLVARSLWGIGVEPASLPRLLTDLPDHDPWVRLWVVRALTTLGPALAPAVPPLVEALADPSPMVRDSLAWALLLAGPDPLPPLREALGSLDPALRRGAAEALGRVRDPARREALESALGDADEGVRFAAAEALPGAEGAVRALGDLLRSPAARSRERAAYLLGGLGPEAAPAVSALASTLADSDPLVRQACAWALGRVGPPAAQAVPALQAATRDEDPVTADLAWLALS
jgi:HEAT repeat protein